MLKPFPFDDEWLFFVYKNKKKRGRIDILAFVCRLFLDLYPLYL